METSQSSLLPDTPVLAKFQRFPFRAVWLKFCFANLHQQRPIDLGDIQKLLCVHDIDLHMHTPECCDFTPIYKENVAVLIDGMPCTGAARHLPLYNIRDIACR